MWDGLEFFGFDLKKIPRLYKKPVKWTDKFTDWESTPILAITAFIVAFITYNEVHKVVHWHEKQQTI